MNIFKNYLDKVKKVITPKLKELNIDSKANYESVVFETPPENFDFDLSSNIALVLGKKSKQNPRQLAIKIKDILINNLKEFKEIQIAGPGFLNFTLSDKIKKKIILDILDCKNKFGSSSEKTKYNVEFVSANPTGPMHVGHCRGAIFGDVLSNLLLFNGNKVTKEYYVNDYGNQIKNFTKSVFFRLREIRFKEKFVNEEDLYPGEYIIDIAKIILKKNIKIKLDNFEEIFPNVQCTRVRREKERTNLIFIG